MAVGIYGGGAGLKLSDILREKGITAKQVSEQTGIKYGTMLKYSSGERNMSIKAAKKIGTVLGIDWWKLFEEEVS